MRTIALLITVCFACGPKPPPTYNFVGSSAVPAASGTAVVTIGPNNNSKVQLSIRNLAPPERLDPSATVYVVWIEPLTGGAPQNVGALRLDANLTGSLTTVTPLRNFKLMIGAEADQRVQAPTRAPVITTTIALE